MYYGSYGSYSNDSFWESIARSMFGSAEGTAAIVIILLSVVATILIAALIMPKKKRPMLTGFAAWLHDVVNFRGLIIEVILRVLYVFFSILYILIGLYLLFDGNNFWACLALIVLGPVGVRLVFELLMLVVLGVQNVIEINHKLGGGGFGTAGVSSAKSASSASSAPRYSAPGYSASGYSQSGYSQSGYAQSGASASSAPKVVFCGQCGCRYDANKSVCPSCGSSNPD